MSQRKSDGKQQLRKQPRMRRVESASSTSLPNLSVPKTARQRKFRNSTQRIRRPLSSVRAFVLNSRWFSVVIVALAIYTLYLIGSDERFYLSYIPVEGSSTIEINDIVAESGLAGSHIFAADPQEAADKISRIGGVITSTVTLHWPNEVMIRIREKPPLATWQEGETLYWIDADGHLTNARAQTVGLLNIMEERDVQIRGYRVRLPLDVYVVASANPEDYTNRGRIITPLKDRYGSQIRTHYPETIELEMEIMSQEALPAVTDGVEVIVPQYMREIIAEITHLARRSHDISQRSGVSVRMSIANYENVIANAAKRFDIAVADQQDQ